MPLVPDDLSLDEASLDEASLDEASPDEASLDEASLDEASPDEEELPMALRTAATTSTETSTKTSTPTRTRARRPLVVTGDDDLLDELLRLAAAGGTEVEVAADPAAARGHYATAPLVLVGVDQAQACVRARLPRRTGVVIVFWPDQVTEDPATWARQLGGAHLAALPAAQPWLIDRLAGSGDRPAPAPVVAVLGGRGGAGASVLATGLAVTAAAFGRKVLLVDGDPLGGGIDMLLGWEDDGGVRWPELTGTSGRLDATALLGALPGRGDLALVSFDRRELPTTPPEAMAAVLAAGRHARDLVVVDTPRRLDDAAVVALQTADLGLLVVPAEVRAVTASAKVAAAASTHCGDLQLVVRGPAPGGMTPDEIGRSLKLPVAATLRPERGLAATVEGGLPPTATGRGPLAKLCRRIVVDLCASTGEAVAA